ncbi:hypothetical protein MUN77_01540 [Leucobacter allii]|uniref:hypothetical protein n=1 Tax=Leucobacter allii TaxID=2932247 RepID=UPI001FD5515C|nr:hypothetical protein [Leucobacter allii]UOR02042.1 hypothetical protein MUN77_01540 [Leucobacter allii]
MSEHPKCERCEEPVKPVVLERLPLIGRFVGKVGVVVRTIHLTSIRQRLSALGAYERADFSRTDVTLCDQCWGAFLTWACEPGQERAKIAAENRRKDQRLREVAERRREEQVQRYMKEGR